jgi:hypothetical protein
LVVRPILIWARKGPEKICESSMAFTKSTCKVTTVFKEETARTRRQSLSAMLKNMIALKFSS